MIIFYGNMLLIQCTFYMLTKLLSRYITHYTIVSASFIICPKRHDRRRTDDAEVLVQFGISLIVESGVLKKIRSYRHFATLADEFYGIR